MEIEIPRGGLWVGLALLVIGACNFVGYLVSPRAGDGRPVLLSPDVRAVENYRRQVVGWVADWTALDEHLRAVTEPEQELLTQSRAAQAVFERAVAIARAVDGEDAPPALLGLRDQASATAAAYVDASMALNRWLSAPSPENQAAAGQTHGTANGLLMALVANEWVAPWKSHEVAPPTPTLTAPLTVSTPQP